MTLVFIIAAIAGWTAGYYVVMTISAVNLLYFFARERNMLAFPVQIRVVYFAWTLLGLWPDGRLIFYILLLLGTFMVVFTGRCSIALVLKYMPWNQGRQLRQN